MLISAREAAEILAPAGLSREPARRLLLAGFAGEGIRTRGALLYDDARVCELAARPWVGGHALAQPCVQTMIVARLAPRRPAPGATWRGVDLTADEEEQREGARTQWQMSPYARVFLRELIATRGAVPLVVTVSGFVALGADIREVTPDRAHGTVLTLDAPGSWFDGFAGTRFPTGPGSAWLLWRQRGPGARRRQDRRLQE